MTECPTRSGPFKCSKTADAQGQHEPPCEAQAPEYATQTVFVAKNGWWWDACPKHGRTMHLQAIGGRCTECQKEGLSK